MEAWEFPLFANLENEEILKVVEDCRQVSFDAGTTFIEEGSRGGHIFFLLQGQVSVFLASAEGSEQELAVIGSPAVIGELEAVTGERRSASVRARSDVTALELDFELLHQRLREGDPTMTSIFLHTARVIAHRLAAMNRKFAELQQTAGGPRYHELRDFQEKLLNEWTV